MAEIAITCRDCAEVTLISVNADDYTRWRKGELIQNAMPYLNADQREMFISRTCPKCWDKLMKDMGEI